MNKFDQLRNRPLNNTSKFDQFRSRQMQKEESSQLANLTKAAASGVLSNLDLPQNVASLVEEYGINPAKNLYHNLTGIPSKSSINFFSSLPSLSSKVKGGLKNYLDIDLEPTPKTAGERVATKAAEFAGSLAGLGGAIGRGAGLAARGTEAAKLGTLGAAIGGTSGTLQEGGIDPLAADITSILAVPMGGAAIKRAAKGSQNLFNRFFSGKKQQLTQEKLNKQAGELLRKNIGEKNIPEVLKRLDSPAPLGAQLPTAELAQNTGLAQLHRATQGTIPQLAEKEAANDTIIRKELAKLGKAEVAPEISGEAVRNKLTNNLAARRSERATITEPLYEQLYALEDQVPLNNLTKFLDQEKKFAKGTKKNTLSKIEHLINSEAKTEQVLKNFEQDYVNLNPIVKNQIKEQLGLTSKLKPAEVKEVVEELGLMINKAKKLEQNSIANLLMKAKNAILEDIAVVPEERIARNAYAELSAPISAIEQQPFLKKLIKKDEFEKEFLLDPAQIPGMVLNQSPRNVKALLNQVGDNKKVMDVIRGSVVDDLLNKSELSAIGARGEAKLSYNGLNKYIKRNKPKLDLIFDKDQLKVLEDVREILRRRNLVATTGRAAGSDTAANLTILEAITDSTKQKLLKQSASKSPVIKAAMAIYDAFAEIQQQELKKLLEKALIDPVTAKSLLTPLSNVKNTKTLSTIIQEIYPPSLGVPVLNNSTNPQEESLAYGLQ